MNERRREGGGFAPPAVGGSSLLVVFAVLALTVFALLGLSTVRADVRLADASAQAVADYYTADCQAQEILARLRNGETPEGVERWGSGLCYASYACPISDTQELQVVVRLSDGSEGYKVECWQAVPVGQWEYNEGLDVWDGTGF